MFNPYRASSETSLIKPSGELIARPSQGSLVKDDVQRIPSVRSIVPKIATYLTSNSFNSNRGNIQEVDPEFDLKMISKALKTEEMFQTFVTKIKERLMNGGWEIASRSRTTEKLIKDKLDRICERSDTPFDIIIDSMVHQYATTSNSLLFMDRRKDEFTTGSPVKVEGRLRTIKPVRSLEVLDICNTRPAVSLASNKVARWHVYKAYDRDNFSLSSLFFGNHNGSILKRVDAGDVAHLTLHKEAGFVFGCPIATPIISDIQELRKFEELAGIISYQRANPLIHATVGTKEEPAIVDSQGREVEVDQVAKKLEQMPMEGIFVTSNKVELQSVIEGYDAEKLMGIINHYKTRVREGFGISSLDQGDNSNTSRGSASELDKKGVERAEYMGWGIETYLNFSLIRALQREEGIDPHDNDVNAHFQFGCLDRGNKEKQEEHALSMYTQNAITLSELREELGRRQLTDEEAKDLHIENITKRRLELEAEFGQKAGEETENTESRATQRTRGSNQFGGSKTGQSSQK